MSDKLSFQGLLGKGGFANVISVSDSKGHVHALKKPFHKTKWISELPGIVNMKELYIMAHINHPYIQSATKIYYEDPCPLKGDIEPEFQYDQLFFLMDKANGSLHDLIHKHGAPTSHRKRLMFQAACGLQFLHSKNICHRDIKPGNILYHNKPMKRTDTGAAFMCPEGKISDFGMTKPLNFVTQNSLHAGTPYYRAPEVYLGNKNYNYSMDVWALGCTFFELITGRVLFEADGDLAVLEQIFTRRGSPSAEVYKKLVGNGPKVVMARHKPKHMSVLLNMGTNSINLFNRAVSDGMYSPGTFDQFADLLEKMLQLDPSTRLTMDEVLLHPFFSGYFVKHEADYGLWRPDHSLIDHNARIVEEMNHIMYYPKDHVRLWEGTDEIADCNGTLENMSYEIIFFIMFHGLDLFYRFLLKIFPDTSNDPYFYKKIAWCCCYMMNKYHLDEGAYNIYSLFPRARGHFSIEEVVKMERLIIEVVKFEIYSPTWFTYVEKPCFYTPLFVLTRMNDLMFGRPIKLVMRLFNGLVNNVVPTISLPGFENVKF